MQAGTLVAQRYRIDDKIGEGGMGVVFKAHDTLLDRPVAIKVLSPQVVAGGAERLLREARSVAQLDHPHIVGVYDAGEIDGQPYIVMQLVAGKSLRDVSVSPDDAITYMKQVCLALQYAHEKGLIHRDIKPDNIMVTVDGTVKVMDFGLARSQGRTRLTQAGTIVGTVAYIAPEQVLRGEADARSDLYSLGCVFYELVTARPPFTGEDPISIISQHLQVPPVAPHWYRAEIPPELEGIILKLMAKDPAERFASAQDVLIALDGLTTTMQAPLEAPKVSPTLLLGTVLRTRMVGRDAELREIKSGLELAASGHGQVIFVEGEPGIGKTRLLQEAQVYARLRGFTVLLGHCYEQETVIPYLPFIELFQSRFRDMERSTLREDLGPTAPEFVKLIPEVRGTLADVEPSPPLEPVQERLRLFSSIARYLSGASRRSPLVLVLEDLHRADAASLNLLQHLARALRGERVVILGSYRDVELNRKHPLADILREMNRERLYTLVNLHRLRRDGVRAMVQAMFETNKVADEFLDVLYAETEGNPFFVEEVLKSLVEEGVIAREDGEWRRVKAVGEFDIPKSIKEVVGRRLERVSDPCQRALSLATVIGRRFQFEVLQAVGELKEDELLDALEEAMRAQLIREESAAGEVEEYDFAHALLREVLYEQLSLRRRRLLHQKVGEVLEKLYVGRIDAVVEDLAHHFTRAPQGEGLGKAIRYSLDAARKSMSLYAHDEAVKYYQNAAELLQESGDARRLAETYVALGEPFIYLANTAAAVEAYKNALTFYEQQGTESDVARMHRLIGGAYQRHWNFADAIPHLERALEHLSAQEHKTDVIQTHLDLARAMAFSGNSEAAERYAEQAIALAKASGDDWMRADAHATLGLIAQGRSLDEAVTHYKEAIRLARKDTTPTAHYTLGRSLNNMATAHTARGEYNEALRLYTEALEVGRRYRDVEQIAFMNMQLGIDYVFRGDWRAAKALLADNLQMPAPLGRIQQSQSILRIMEGNLESAVSLSRDAAKFYRVIGNLQEIARSCTILAWANLELGHYTEARDAALEDASSMARLAWRYTRGYMAAIRLEALARGGDFEQAETLCSDIEEVSTRVGNVLGVPVAQFGRGVLAAERGEDDAAIRLLDESLSMIEGLPLVRARALHQLARVLVRRGDHRDIERAKRALQECLTLFGQMGDTRKAQQVQAEFPSLG